MRILAVLAMVLLASCGSPSAPKETQAKPGVALGPAPALPAGFPPVYPPAALGETTSSSSASGWERTFTYSIMAKTPELVKFYREQLPKFGLKMTAEGGGPYGAMLRAQDETAKRQVMVEIDAPEDKPAQAPNIKIVVLDSK